METNLASRDDRKLLLITIINTVLHLWRKYGRKNDSLEFTLRGNGCRIDLFWMYEDVNPPKNNVVPSGKDNRYNWVGLQTFNNYQKVRKQCMNASLSILPIDNSWHGHN